MRTEDLIAELASRAAPVRPLPSPAVRLLGWSGAALAGAGVWLSIFGTRPHVVDLFTRPDFLATAALAAATTLCAGAASLVLAIPGAERSGVLRGAATALAASWALLLTVATIRAGHGLAGVVDWPICFVRVIAMALIPGIVLFAMLRRAAPLRFRWTSALAAVAALSIAAGAIQFICPIDDAGHALLGHFGPVLVGAVLGLLAARRFLK